MRLIIIGPPGSERDSVAELIAARLGVPAIRLSDVVKIGVRANSPATAQAMRHMNAGEVVPNRVILAIVRDRLTWPDAASGYLLDGFPHHVVPPVALDAVLADLGAPVDRAIDLVLPDTEVLRRLSGRRMCRGCGRLWHTESAAPARPDVCDTCGGELFRPYNDAPERITGGLQSYRPGMAPTLDHYRSHGKLVSIDATRPVAEIVAEALK